MCPGTRYSTSALHAKNRRLSRTEMGTVPVADREAEGSFPSLQPQRQIMNPFQQAVNHRTSA